MSLTPRLTTIGLYNYDPTIFENLNLPEAVDKATLINQFLLTYGECPVLYTDAAFYKFAVKIWSDSHYDSVERIAAALAADYNPIHNYDRFESYTDTHTGQSKDSGTDTRTDDFTRTDNLTRTDDLTRTDNLTRTDDLTQTNDLNSTSHGQRTDNLTDENTVSAYNESTYQPDSKQTHTGTQATESSVDDTGTIDNTGTVTNTGTVSNAGTVTNTGTVGNEGTSATAYGKQTDTTGTDEHTAHLYGNIGVTTSQEMIEAEIKLRKESNLYEIVAGMMKADLCLLIY